MIRMREEEEKSGETAESDSHNFGSTATGGAASTAAGGPGAAAASAAASTAAPAAAVTFPEKRQRMNSEERGGSGTRGSSRRGRGRWSSSSSSSPSSSPTRSRGHHRGSYGSSHHSESRGHRKNSDRYISYDHGHHDSYHHDSYHHDHDHHRHHHDRDRRSHSRDRESTSSSGRTYYHDSRPREGTKSRFSDLRPPAPAAPAKPRAWEDAPLPSQSRGKVHLPQSELDERLSKRPECVNKKILRGLKRVKWETVSGGNPLTYVLSGHVGLNHEMLEDIFRRVGWVAVPPNVDRAMFVWVELFQKAGFDKRATSVPCEVKNVVNDQKLRITDKWLLYSGMEQYFPDIAKKYMAATRKLVEVDEVPAGRQLICKPVGRLACAGHGITRVESTEKLIQLKPQLLEYCKDYIASEYISNLLLWHGRKFHLRMYWLVRPASKGMPFFQKLHDTGKIMTAALPYENKDFENTGIHDTHVKSTLRNLFFPNDLDGVSPEQCQVFFRKMEEVLYYVGQLLCKTPLGPYPESRYAYEVFGCDFLLTTDNRVILMEINQRIGMRSVPTDMDQKHYDDFAAHYYRWVFDNAIAPLLEPYIKTVGRTIPELPPPPPPVGRRTGEDPPFPTAEEYAAAAEEKERMKASRATLGATRPEGTAATSSTASSTAASAEDKKKEDSELEEGEVRD